jgi:hypothetical protein
MTATARKRTEYTGSAASLAVWFGKADQIDTSGGPGEATRDRILASVYNFTA